LNQAVTTIETSSYAEPVLTASEEQDLMRFPYAGYYSEPVNSYAGLALSF
jgi:hypothetical protein